MLGNFRQKVLKIGSMLLFGLLIISFGVWGIGDHLPSARHAASQVVATVGDIDIGRHEVNNEVNAQVRRLRELLGTEIDSEQARQMGLVDAALETIVQRDLVTIGAQDLGLLITNEVVSAEIRADERFADATGNFDRNTFSRIINSNNLTEASYIRQLRGILLQRQFLSAVETASAVPTTLVDPVYRHRNQRRVAEVIRLDHAKVPPVGEPSSTDVEKFHKENAALFTAPEYRQITLAELKIADIVDEIDIPPSAIEEEYQARLDQYSTPAQRQLQQILVEDEAKIREVYSKVALGEDFTKVAADVAGLDAAAIDLGLVSKDQIPLPELADAAFLLDKGAISQPIKSDLGWHVLRVVDAVEARTRPLSEVRDEIRKFMAEDKAVDELFRLANQFEDTLGGGATIEEAGAQLNVKVRKINSLNALARDAKDEPVIGLDRQSPILRVAFETEEGEESALNDLGDNGYFILKVDKVIPPTLRPLDSVRDQVITAWKERQAADAAANQAKDLMQKLKDGVPPAEIAKSANAELSTTKPFLRTGQGLEQRIPGTLITQLFSLNRGEVASAPSADAHYIAKLVDIVTAVPSADNEGLGAVRERIAGEMNNDLVLQLTSALRERHGVTINRASLDSIF